MKRRDFFKNMIKGSAAAGAVAVAGKVEITEAKAAPSGEVEWEKHPNGMARKIVDKKTGMPFSGRIEE